MAKPPEQQEPPSHLRPLFNNRMETSGPKKESSKSRPAMTAKAQVGSIKDPLTSVDGGFTVVGPHSGSGKLRFSFLAVLHVM